MAIGIYVEGWDEQPTKEVHVCLNDKWPQLDEEVFEDDRLRDPEHVWRDETSGRYYMIEEEIIDPFPSESFANDNWGRLLSDLKLGHKNPYHDELNANEVDMLFKRLMVRRNKKMKELESEVVQESRVIEYIPGNEYYDRAYARLLEVVKFAKQQNKTIYWA